MFAAVDPMTWVAAGYALVLLGSAYGIDQLARRAARALEARQNPGFTYHESHDAWLCPEDQWLWPQSYDPGSRVMRYRGAPSICNSCPVKDTCTTSLSGREVVRDVDPWPASEAARFHRGIACTLTVLALVWPLATLASGPGLVGGVILGAVTAVVIAGAIPLWLFLVRTPADPTGVLEHDADANIEARKAAARAYDARRTTYRSERLASVAARDDILGDDLTPMDIYDGTPADPAGQPVRRGGGRGGGRGAAGGGAGSGAWGAGHGGAAFGDGRLTTTQSGGGRSGEGRSSWREVAARIDSATANATTHHRYRSDRIRAEQEAIRIAEEEATSTA